MGFVSERTFQNEVGHPNHCFLKSFIGNRGKNYAQYAEQFPDLLRVVGVAEPREHARHHMQKKYSIPSKQWVDILLLNDKFCWQHLCIPFMSYEGIQQSSYVVIQETKPDNSNAKPSYLSKSTSY